MIDFGWLLVIPWILVVLITLGAIGSIGAMLQHPCPNCDRYRCICESGWS